MQNPGALVRFPRSVWLLTRIVHEDHRERPQAVSRVLQPTGIPYRLLVVLRR